MIRMIFKLGLAYAAYRVGKEFMNDAPVATPTPPATRDRSRAKRKTPARTAESDTKVS